MDDKQRRSHRVTFPQPREGQVGRRSAFVIDVSLGGLRVAQEEKPGTIGDTRRISFEWEGRRASFGCELRWLAVQHSVGRASYARSLYHAGYQVVQATAESYDIVRGIVHDNTARAAD